MQTGIDCLACFMQQALTTIKLSTDDEALQKKLLIRVASMFEDFDMELAPPENLVHCYRFIAEMTHRPDPFADIKKQSNDFALGVARTVSECIDRASDPLLAALRFAIGGNVLDNGAQNQLDIRATLDKCQGQQIGINHYPLLKEKLSEGGRILLLTDNCGEIVFDRLLIQRLTDMGREVTVAVRGAPVINDATPADAAYCGIDSICPVISSGADIPGTSLAQCSEEFRNAFNTSDCILSKGMGNFECLSDVPAPIFFLLTVKCTTVLNYLKRLYPEAPLDIGSPVIAAPFFHSPE